MRRSLHGGLLAALLMAAGGQARALSTNIQDYVTHRLDDFTATIIAVQADQRELGKISKDAGLLYRFREVHVQYKEPNKIRFDAAMEGTKAVVILNGAIQYVSVPRMHLSTKRNFGPAPGKRKSLMDVGLVSEYFLSYTNAQYLREASVEGSPCAVFEIRYKDQSDDTSHHIFYIDPKTRVVRKRESYSQSGKLQAVYLYKDVREVAPGIWFPTRIEAMSTDHQIAGITQYRDIKVNVGIADRVFEL